MRKITMFLLALFLFGFVGGSFIQVEASTTVSYEVTGVFESDSWVGRTGSGTRGNTASFDLTSVPAGHNFVFWIVNGVVRRDLPGAYEHTLTTTNKLQIIYAPTGKYAAVFIDLNNKFIGVEYTTGGAVLDSGLVMPLARPGFVVDTLNKWTSIAGSSTLADVQEHSVFVLNYEEAVTPVGAVTLSVTNGSYSVSNPVPFNSLVTATADAAPSEQVFAGWEENGVIVSYNPQYQFTALYNKTLVATYAASVTPQPIVNFGVIGVREGYFSYLGQVEIPTGLELSEYGFIYHSSSESAITLETVGVVVGQSTNRQISTNEYITSIGNLNYRSIRAYAIFGDDESEIVVYSEKTLLHYQEDFELSALTGTYLNGTFTGNNDLLWTYGHSRNEYTFAIDGKGIMLRRASDSFVEVKLTNGVGVFQFEYRKAFTGSAERQLEVLVNTISIHTGIRHTYTVTEVDSEVFIITITINQPGTVTIRIKNVGSTTHNRQMTLDNFRWTNYPG